MAKIVDTHLDINGRNVTHTFESELPEITPCSDWIKANKSDAEYQAFYAASTTGEHTEATLTTYKEWLDAFKIHHTIEYSDGDKNITDYKTYTV